MGEEWGMLVSFNIDGPSYDDRDREMFVCGYEFAQVYNHIMKDPGKLQIPIHRDNESRIKIMCGKFKRRCTITPCSAEHDPDGTWSDLVIHATGAA